MIVKDKYGYFFRGQKITEEKYNKILEMLKNRPEAPEGYGCRLTDELEWELYEVLVIEDTDPELTENEVLDIILGGNA